MTPRRLDPDSVQRKLVSLRDLLDQLEELEGADLVGDPVRRGATLWAMTQLVAIAAGACAHVSSAALHRSPSTHAEAFELAVRAGAVDADLLDDLRGASGMRNRLVHEYGEIDLAIVAAAVPKARQVFGALVVQLARHLLDADPA